MNVWTLAGILSLLIALVGVVLPLLPTTPFVILAAGCFARSSPRLHAWLLHHPLFGPVLQNWETRRCIPRKIRRLALTMMIGMGGVSVVFLVPLGWLTVLGIALIVTGCVVLLRIPVCEA